MDVAITVIVELDEEITASDHAELCKQLASELSRTTLSTMSSATRRQKMAFSGAIKTYCAAEIPEADRGEPTGIVRTFSYGRYVDGRIERD